MLNAHNVLQVAKQISFGTAVTAATAKLQNVSSFSLNPDLQTRALDQLRGTLAPTHQSALESFSMMPGMYEYPVGSGNWYAGVMCYLQIKEHISG